MEIASYLQDIVKPFAGLTEADVSVSLPFGGHGRFPKEIFTTNKTKTATICSVLTNAALIIHIIFVI